MNQSQKDVILVKKVITYTVLHTQFTNMLSVEVNLAAEVYGSDTMYIIHLVVSRKNYHNLIITVVISPPTCTWAPPCCCATAAFKFNFSSIYFVFLSVEKQMQG